jgi:hypothetical protein
VGLFILVGVILVVVWPRSVAAQPAAPDRGCGASTAPSPIDPSAFDRDEMSTDRPDITDSTDIVGRRRWQVESGLVFGGDRQDGVSLYELAAPLPMVRVGVSDRVEFRLSAEGVLSERLSDAGTRTRSTGRSDVQAGMKWKLFARRCFVVALEPVLSLPSGGAGFSSGSYDPTLKVIVDRPLARGFSLSTNVVVSSSTDEGRRFTPVTISASLAHALARGWTGFAEIARVSALGRGGESAWTGDAGAVHPLGHRAQVDVSAGRGLSGAAQDWFIGAGIAVRGVLGR